MSGRAPVGSAVNVDLFQPRATGSAGKGYAVKSPESIPLFLSDMTPGVGGGTFKSVSWRNSFFGKTCPCS